MDKIGHISVHDFASISFTKCVITFAISIIFHEIFRIDVKLNFFLISYLWSREKNFPENFVIWLPNFSRDQLMKNPNIERKFSICMCSLKDLCLRMPYFYDILHSEGHCSTWGPMWCTGSFISCESQ